MGGAKFLRRVVGVAHIVDLEAVGAGRQWVLERYGVDAVADRFALVRAARDAAMAA
jgi:hypothetical protein